MAPPRLGISACLPPRFRTWLAAAAAILPLAVSPRSAAQAITPVAVQASTTYGASQTPLNLINGSGLSGAGEVLTRTHDNQGSAQTMWHSAGGPVASTWLEFDLGISYTLTGLHVWNMNQANLTGRGIRSARVLSSPDATGAISDLVGTYEFSQGSGSAGLAAQLIPFDPPLAGVRRVRFEVLSVWSGAANEYTGLSEVRFEGSAPAAVIVSPKSATNYVLGQHTFSVTAGGAAPLEYQWFKVGTPDTPIASPLGSKLVLDDLTLDSAGGYYVVVTSGATTATSEIATLTVLDPPPDLASDLLAHYAFDESAGTVAADSSGNAANATLFNFPADNSMWVPGRVGGALHFNAGGVANNQRVVTDGPLALLNEDAFSFAFWARLSSANNPANPRLVVPVGNEHWVLWAPGTGTGFYPPAPSAQPTLDVWQHYVITYDRLLGNYEIFVNGRKQTEASGYSRLSPAFKQWVFGSNENLTNNLDPWRGLMDELRIYNRLLRPGDVNALYLAAGAPPPPRLEVTVSNGFVTVSWPPDLTGYTLHSSTTLLADDWEPVLNVFNNSVTLPIEGYPREFYRLIED
jgi:hypothetical protein